MPTIQRTLHGTSRTLDARPDRYDVRDRPYQPKLVNLPPVFPDPALIKSLLPKYEALVLNQQSEGACTGFGLAAMVNYLLFKEVFMTGRKVAAKKPPKSVSARMLYELARLYDEWPGEDYQGSSCRGAMKGWHKHGVCLETTWPYQVNGQPGKPKADWNTEASGIPLGAYYRVDREELVSMQSAIWETGAIYVSAAVHAGWNLGGKTLRKVGNLPVVEWKPGVEGSGGHAFALVGYNPHGFIVQNSWGPEWGYHGFALLTYEDWLENGTDAWVATLGVPIENAARPQHISFLPGGLPAGSASPVPVSAAAAKTAPWSEDLARRHSLLLGNDGVALRTSGAYADAADEVDRGLIGGLKAWLRESSKHRDVVIYAHGGLNSEAAAVKRVQILAPYFKANGVYPLFVVWKTGWQESLLGMGADIIHKLLPDESKGPRAAGFLDWAKEKLNEAWDYTVETSLGFLGKALWGQMKQNAAAAARPGHGADLLGRGLASVAGAQADLRIHIVGHSAGSIWLGHVLDVWHDLRNAGGAVGVKTCHLFAAACSVPFANAHYQPAITTGLVPPKQFHNTILGDDAERDDNVAGFYRKSLLYFVSRASEDKHKTPILGMEAAWNKIPGAADVFHEDFNKEVAAWRKFAAAQELPAPALIPAGAKIDDGVKVSPPSHGGFDNDITVITTTLRRILGLPASAALPHPVTSLAGY